MRPDQVKSLEHSVDMLYCIFLSRQKQCWYSNWLQYKDVIEEHLFSEKKIINLVSVPTQKFLKETANLYMHIFFI